MSTQRVLSTTAPAVFEDATRIVEALLFASREPLGEDELAKRVPKDVAIAEILQGLADQYASRGVHLVRVAGKWAFRTANDLSSLLVREQTEPRKLSRAALETLAILAYHQPVTRAEIESIRGVATSKGTLDVLLETGWARIRGRRKAPGRPVTYGTTTAFLEHFGLSEITDLPGLQELKGAGFFEGTLPQGFAVPAPSDNPALRDDEDPLEDDTLLSSSDQASEQEAADRQEAILEMDALLASPANDAADENIENDAAPVDNEGEDPVSREDDAEMDKPDDL